MNSDSVNSDDVEPPNVSSWLLGCLAENEEKYESQYAEALNEDERALIMAQNALQGRAKHLITTGVVSGELADALAEIDPTESLIGRVRDLLGYQIVHHRAEFEIAEDVCTRLDDLDRRVITASVLAIVLLGYSPSPTVLKYFQRALTLYLAGYEPETVIMCGAVVEQALAVRIGDDELRKSGWKPIYKDAGYSIGQRLKYEETHPIFTTEQRQLARNVVNWRNDAIHVQLDIGPKPVEALSNVVVLLPVILAH